MEFVQLQKREGDSEARVFVDITLSEESVDELIGEFEEAVSHFVDIDKDSKHPTAIAEEASSSPDINYGQLLKDFIINKSTAVALKQIGVTPIFTPGVHAEEAPLHGEAYSFELSILTMPEFSLTSTEPVEVSVEIKQVTENDIDVELHRIAEEQVRYVLAEPRSLLRGDSIRVDIETTKAGESFWALTGKGRIIELAEEDVPAAFIDEVLKMSVGDTKSISYRAYDPTSQDKEAIVDYSSRITIHELLMKEVPAIDDEWVSSSFEGIATVDELRSAIQAQLQSSYDAENQSLIAKKANEELSKRLRGTIPDEYYEAARDNYRNKLVSNLEKNGATVEEYCQDIGIDEHELNLEMLVKSGEMLRQGLALETLFSGKGFELHDSDIELAIRTGFGRYEGLTVATLEQRGMRNLVETAAKRQKALEWLIENARVVAS